MGSEFGSRFHSFVVLALVVIVAVDRLSKQTALAQLISAVLVMLIIAAYLVSNRSNGQQEEQ